MEIINNRYRLVELLDQNKMVSKYAAIDLLNDNRFIQLNLLNSEYTPKSLVDFYAKRFITIKNINHPRILRNFEFNSVSFVDNRIQGDKLYYYTAQYDKQAKPFLAYLDDLSIGQVVETFMEICAAIHYLHLRGFIYGSLNPHSILVIESENGNVFKLKDLATVELEKYARKELEETYFISPKALASDELTYQSDMYSLGAILLTMLTKKSEWKNANEDIWKLQADVDTGNISDHDTIRKVLPIVQKLLTTNEAVAYNNVLEMVNELGVSLDREFSIIDSSVIEELQFHTEVIGRDLEIELILKNVENLMGYRPGKRIFFVQGDNGIGKTRVLQEINYLLSIQRANVYASFQLDSTGSSKNLWIDILQKLIAQTDVHILRKYHAELLKYFPELEKKEATVSLEYLLDGNNKYRLLNRIASFIHESLQGKTAVFLIDDLHLADRFTLDLFTYLSTNTVHQTNLMFILSGEVREDSENRAFLDTVDMIYKRSDANIIRLNPLTQEQSAQLIKDILFISYPPMKLAERIYSRSYGNPLFIHEVMKDLYSRQLLVVSPENGMWSVRLSADDYSLLEIPDSIEQALLNQLQDIARDQMELLEIGATYNKAVSPNMISEFLNWDIAKAVRHIGELVRKGILQQLVSDTGYLYDFHNKVLKRIVYEGITPEERMEKHARIANMLEWKHHIKLEELIFHFEGASNTEKCIYYYMKIADELHERHEIKAEIPYLQKAVLLLTDDDEKTKLLLRIGDLSSEVNDMETSLTVLEEALALARRTNHKENIVAAYLAIANLYANLYKVEQLKGYLEQVSTLLTDYDDKGSRLEYRRLQALELNLENKPDEAAAIIREVIDEAGTDFPRITGSAYLLLGFSSIQHNQATDAISYYEKAMELFEKAGYTKGYLGAVNNIGVIYQAYLSELDKAKEYFVKVQELSEEYGIYETEIRAVSSIGNIHASAFHYQEAYEQFKYALQKAKLGASDQSTNHLYNLLCFVCTEMNDYKTAFQYYEVIKDELDVEIAASMRVFDYHNTSMNLFQAIGDYALADKSSREVVAFNQGRENIYSYSALIYQTINKLRSCNDEDIEGTIAAILELVAKIPRKEFNVKVLFMSTMVLIERAKLEMCERLIQSLEEYLSEQMPDILKASYYYVLGAKGNTKEGKENLARSLNYAKRAQSRELIARVMLLLGDYAFQEDNLYSAAGYYLEGTEMVKLLVKELPVTLRLTYVSSQKFVRGFIRLERIYERLIGEQVEFLSKDVFEAFTVTKEELDRMLEQDYVSSFVGQQDFMEYTSEQHMKNLSEDIRSTSDILFHVSANTMKNIDMVLRYFAGITLATKGAVIMENQQEELKVLCATDGRLELPPNHFMINRVRSTKQPFILNDKEQPIDWNLLSKELHGALYIPIIQKHGSSNKHHVLLGYVYLETDQLVNNFNNYGISKCLDMMGFLAAMVEKHQLKLSATIDKLTGALTRKYLDDALHETVEFSREAGESFSLIMFDLDRFKQVNDRYGHQIGDSVLQKVSSTVMNCLEDSHVLGRYGGEEFVIILPSIGTEEAVQFAEMIRNTVTSQRLLGDNFEITISMGIATYPQHGQHVKELIEKADQALYMAKENGRNNCQIWNKDFLTKFKPQNKLSGILTGDDIKDSRNVLAMVELIQLNNRNLSVEEKIYQFIGRIIEIAEAQIGYIIMNTSNGQKHYGRKAQEEEWVKESLVDQEILNSVLLEERGVYMINWEATDKINQMNGLPDWDSILAVPIMADGNVRGAIYLSTPSRMKEFGADDLNMLNVYSSLVAGMI
ncbi:diguanylate cyclase [Ornithinibacillus californiensis]|uniref:diguanylate cyclase n=1 Tax=Ornithinibacillus californiensis TaxID=161536 RepID=UPI00064D7716|nr:diguanylate cyclase [Ornithinibacillus californiensis]